MVPLTLAVIALLLYLTSGTLTETAIVMPSLPFALVGGVWAMWLLDYNLSIVVAVGFIALAGVAAETGAEVMQRIAAPMIGGMVTSTMLTLVVIPVVYFIWRRRGLGGSGGSIRIGG